MVLFAIRVVRLSCVQFKYIGFYIIIVYDNILSVFLPPVGLYTGGIRPRVGVGTRTRARHAVVTIENV